MTVVNFSAHLVVGTVTLERLDKVAIPPMLRSHTGALAEAHAALATSVFHADEARGARSTAMRFVEAADIALATSLQDLAGEMVVARLGTLQKPFAAFGGKGVSYYAIGSRVRAVKEVTILLSTIRSSDLSAAVHAAILKCAKACRAMTEAYAELGSHRVAFRKARGARAVALAEFTRAFSDVKNIAKVAWRDHAETFDIVFGAIEKDRFGKKSHAKKNDPAQPTAHPVSPPASTVTTPPPTTSPTTPAASTGPARPAATPAAAPANGAAAPLAN